MHITSEKDITGQSAKFLREQGHLKQKAFWNAVGVTQSGGCRYEQAQDIPRPVRMLIFMIYVAGLKIDASTPESAQQLCRLAKLQASDAAADREKLGETMLAAKSHLTRAVGLLSGISN